jgi:hypothetical protein
MTRVFTVDENNDLILAGDGDLAISTDLEAVLQACEHAAKAQLAEMVLAVDQGVPNFQTIWQGSPNVFQFEAYLRRQLQNVTGVVEVSELTSTVSDNVLSYTATIQTIYGQGVVNG